MPAADEIFNQLSHSPRPGRTGGFKKADRIVTIGQFRYVYNRGFHASCAAFGCYVVPRRGARSRLGLSVSRKYGDSPERNRFKRLAREAFRRVRDRLPATLDIVVVARRGGRGLPLGELAALLVETAEQAMRLRERRKPRARRK